MRVLGCEMRAGGGRTGDHKQWEHEGLSAGADSGQSPGESQQALSPLGKGCACLFILIVAVN